MVLGLDDAVGCAALAWDVPKGFVLVQVVVEVVVGGRTSQRARRVRSPF